MIEPLLPAELEAYLNGSAIPVRAMPTCRPDRAAPRPCADDPAPRISTSSSAARSPPMAGQPSPSWWRLGAAAGSRNRTACSPARWPRWAFRGTRPSGGVMARPARRGGDGHAPSASGSAPRGGTISPMSASVRPSLNRCCLRTTIDQAPMAYRVQRTDDGLCMSAIVSGPMPLRPMTSTPNR